MQKTSSHSDFNSYSKDEQIRILKAELEKANKRTREVQAAYDRVIEQIKLANVRYFGAKSEKLSPAQLSLFNGVEAECGKSTEPTLESTVCPPRKKKQKGKRDRDLSQLPVTSIIEYELDEDERTCPTCDTPMKEMRVEVTRVVKLIPARFEVEERRRHIYVCEPCSKANAQDGTTKTQFLQAPAPLLPIQKSIAHPSLLAHIAHEKFTLSLPLYRIAQDMKRNMGLAISRQTMANWMMVIADRWLSYIYRRMKDKIREESIIQCDETSVQVLKEPGRSPQQKSYMWLFASPAVCDPCFVFEYHPTRAGSVVREFLKDWSGTIVTDGYQSYFGIPGITNVACLVHVRRSFADLVKSVGEAKAREQGSVALAALGKIAEICHLDNTFDDMNSDDRKAARNEKLRPLMDSFYCWLVKERQLAVPKMALHKALNYAITYWPYVTNALDDGRLPLDNSLCERAIRPFAIGRRNWLFSDTQRGAHTSATLYSIITTAIANRVKPREYLEWVLTELPNASDLSKDNVIDYFMPWSDEVPESFRMTKEEVSKAQESLAEPVIDIKPHTEDIITSMNHNSETF